MQSLIDRLDHELFSLDTKEPTAAAPAEPPNPKVLPRNREVSDQELIRRIAASNESERFLKLFYEGDTSAYPSGSEADMALCGMLAFWTGRDYERTLRLFNSSAIGKLPRLKPGGGRAHRKTRMRNGKEHLDAHYRRAIIKAATKAEVD